jgi:hypothetical protein
VRLRRRRPARASGAVAPAAVQPLLLMRLRLLVVLMRRPVPAASAAHATDRQRQASRCPRIAVARELAQFAPDKSVLTRAYQEQTANSRKFPRKWHGQSTHLVMPGTEGQVGDLQDGRGHLMMREVLVELQSKLSRFSFPTPLN